MMRMARLYRAFGYLHHQCGISWQELTLEHLVAFCPIKTALRKAASFEEARRIEADSEAVAEETVARSRQYRRWLVRNRQISPGSEALDVETWITVAKYLYRHETNRLKADNYQDIPVIVALRAELKQAKAKAAVAEPTIDESLKWLDWPEFLAFVRQLQHEAQPYYKSGGKRSRSAYALSVQRFLIAALLAYMPPDRQRTLRELQVGKTLIKGRVRQEGNKVWVEACEDGDWYIWLKVGDYKTSKIYGEQIHQIPDLLYPCLETWLNELREVLQPTHEFVFTQKDGKPFSTAASFLSVFKRAAFRITGKATTPHLVRHMLVTYLKREGASDEVMRSVAAAMHHSEATQQKDYDQRLPKEKSACAQQVVLSLAQGQPLALQSSQRPVTVESLVHDFHHLSEPDRQRFIHLLNTAQNQQT